MTYPREIVQLSQPFPDVYVHKNPSGGGTYVKHHVIEQRLIQVFGRPPTFERVEIVFGDVAEIKPNPNGNSQRAKEGRPPLKNVIVGVVCRMTVTIAGEKVVVEEVGDCEQPHNWDSDGQRLKDAFSDAYKRCAMRLGCGLHLYSQNEYFLHEEVIKVSQGSSDGTASQVGNPSAQRDDAAPADSSRPETVPTAGKAPTTASATDTPAEHSEVAGDQESTRADSSPLPLCPHCDNDCKRWESSNPNAPKWRCTNPECTGHTNTKTGEKQPWVSWHEDPWKPGGEVEKLKSSEGGADDSAQPTQTQAADAPAPSSDASLPEQVAELCPDRKQKNVALRTAVRIATSIEGVQPPGKWDEILDLPDSVLADLVEELRGKQQGALV